MKKLISISVLILLLFFLSSCIPASLPTSTETPTKIMTLWPTNTPVPTFTPTNTPLPTPTMMGGYSGKFLTTEFSQPDKDGFLQGEIILWNADGSKNRILWYSPLDLDLRYMSINWSPDGQKILVEYWKKDGTEIVFHHPDTPVLQHSSTPFLRLLMIPFFKE